MKCGGYGHIQAECANTWSDDEAKACNEGEDICHELVVPVNLSTTEQCSSNPRISASGPPFDPSTYESPASMTALAPSDIATIDVEICDNEESYDEEMAHLYKIMYEKMVETANENRGLLKHISQLCREKN